MSGKEYPGNFHKMDEIEETPDDYSDCLYQSKKVEKDPDGRPNCYCAPSKRKREGQEQSYSVKDSKGQETSKRPQCLLKLQTKPKVYVPDFSLKEPQIFLFSRFYSPPLIEWKHQGEMEYFYDDSK